MDGINYSNGLMHVLPNDLKKALTSDAKAYELWEGLIPLAWNEWICWTISIKRDATRKEHVERVVSELGESLFRFG